MKDRLKSHWQQYRWLVVGGLWFVALGLGYVGFQKSLGALGRAQTTLDLLYRSLQLFVLEFGGADGPVTWELEVARFLAPSVAAYTAVSALAVIFREQLQMLRMRFVKRHVVICGLGRKGLLLAKRFRERSDRVVIIEKEEGNDFIAQCRDLGAIVLPGNAADQETLRKARVRYATNLISVCGDDGANAEVAVHAKEISKERREGVLTCIIHIFDPQLSDLLREREIGETQTDSFRLEFFNVFDSGARAILREFPMRVFKKSNACPLVVGLGKLGRNLVVQAPRVRESLEANPGEKLRIVVADRDAECKRESLLVRNAGLAEACDLTALQTDFGSAEFQKADFLFDADGRCTASIIYVCIDDDSRSLSTALALHQRLRGQDVPVVVRMAHDAGLATLLGTGEEGCFANLHAFGLLDRTCTLDIILGGTHETIARAIHNEYVVNEARQGRTPETNASMVQWDELPESLKESSRKQADHIGIKLKAIGCGIAPMASWESELFQFTPEEIEKMAVMEHNRWVDERRREGWRYAAGEKNIEKKTSPYLVPWEQLSEDVREIDRVMVRGLTAFLEKAGFRIRRMNKRCDGGGH